MSREKTLERFIDYYTRSNCGKQRVILAALQKIENGVTIHSSNLCGGVFGRLYEMNVFAATDKEPHIQTGLYKTHLYPVGRECLEWALL